MHSPEDKLLLATEVAALYGVSVCIAWESALMRQGLLAQKRFCGLTAQRRVGNPSGGSASA